jgi:tRNA-splicing ligase RtcB
MPAVRLDGATAPIYLWADPDQVEPQALAQLRQIAALPWVFHHVAVMPDVHLGKGATVGAVIAMRHAVAPAAVGVDLGGGMAAAQLALRAEDLPEDLGALRVAVEQAVPVGFAAHQLPLVDQGADLWAEFDRLAEPAGDLYGRAQAQLGTLGGGNHFAGCG